MDASPQMEAQRDLVRALDELHSAAGRPSARSISQLIKQGDYPSAVSHETVRTTLNGQRVPRWETVRSIVSMLASACVNPPRDPDSEATRFLPLWRAVESGGQGTMKTARELALSSGWGAEDGKWTGEAIAGLLINPFGAIQIDPSLAVPHEPIFTEDEWVHAVVRMIESEGAEFAMQALLRILKGDYVGAEEGVPFGYQNFDHEAAEAYSAFRYGCERLLKRLATEPNLLQRSFAAMHADETMDREDRVAMLRAEADLSLLREVLTVTPETWHEVSEEAQHQVFGYLIKQISPMGRAGLPLDQRFQIVWRVPEPVKE
ncbi:hypothetical protein GXW82_23745 [Streptacidiphilus sp. 4-A2]|nr:hypothetical protein [Streptacidiphilus sp. 4-A2]